MQENFEVREEENSRPAPNKKKALYLAVAFIAVALVSSWLTFFVTVLRFGEGELVKFEILKKYIDERSYYEPDHGEMMDAALKAYVKGTGDRYAEYYNAEDFAALKEDNYGRFVGIGVTVSGAEIIYRGDAVSVIEIVGVYDESPALEAGIVKGDMIYSVYTDNGEIFAEDVGLDVMLSKLQGEEGTEVKFSVLRKTDGGYEKIDFSMLRKRVTVNSVTYEISSEQPTVGIVTLVRFDFTTPIQLKNALNTLKHRGIGKVVLDMRGNPGGDLNSVIACASYFLNENDVIISAEDNGGNRVFETARTRIYGETYESCNVAKDDIGIFRDLEIAVIINGGTASAAELLTAVFRDYELAVTVGENSYGKGTMQSIYSLQRVGVDGGIKITTSVYFPPCGENYDGVGIVPDIYVEANGDTDVQLAAAINELVK